MAQDRVSSPPTSDGGGEGDIREVLLEADRIDKAVYAAVASTPSPRLDGIMRRVASAADYSRLSVAAAALLALLGGRRGRQAAWSGLASVAATSAVVNAVVKPLGQRRRPNRAGEGVPEPRHITMPRSHSFPSGHTASAIAFASGAGRVMPIVSLPLYSLAALVGYARVHTGVHYPGDVFAGVMIGAVCADVTAAALPTLRRRGGSDAEPQSELRG